VSLVRQAQLAPLALMALLDYVASTEHLDPLDFQVLPELVHLEKTAFKGLKDHLDRKVLLDQRVFLA